MFESYLQICESAKFCPMYILKIPEVISKLCFYDMSI